MSAHKNTASAAATTATDASTQAATFLRSGTSATSFALATGSKTFTLAVDRQFAVNDWILVSRTSDATKWAFGQITAKTGTSVTVRVDTINGSGTFTDWTLAISGPQGVQGPAGAPGAGTGDVVGPASAVANNLAAFDATTGKLLKDSGKAYPTGTIVGTSDTQTLTNKTISGGTVDNAVIGGTTPAAGTFTTLKGRRPLVSLDAAQTFALDDAATLQRLTGSTNRIWTIPANATVAFAVEDEIEVFNDGTANLTLTAASGVTVNSVAAGSITLTANQGGVLKKVDTNRWIFMGDNKALWA